MRDYVINFDSAKKMSLACYGGARVHKKQIKEDFSFHIKQGIKYWQLREAPSYALNILAKHDYPLVGL